jgi:hypothetical protein
LAFLASGVVEAIAIGQLDSIRCRGQLDGSFFFGRLIKHLLSGGYHLFDDRQRTALDGGGAGQLQPHWRRWHGISDVTFYT